MRIEHRSKSRYASTTGRSASENLLRSVWTRPAATPAAYRLQFDRKRPLASGTRAFHPKTGVASPSDASAFRSVGDSATPGVQNTFISSASELIEESISRQRRAGSSVGLATPARLAHGLVEAPDQSGRVMMAHRLIEEVSVPSGLRRVHNDRYAAITFTCARRARRAGCAKPAHAGVGLRTRLRFPSLLCQGLFPNKLWRGPLGIHLSGFT